MHRIDSTDNVPSLPTPLPAGTPGFFATGTTVRRDWLNSAQEELCNAAEIVDNLDKSDNTQVARAIRAAVFGSAVFVAGATTEHTNGVAVSEDSGASGDRALVAASFETTVAGDRSMALASSGVAIDADSERCAAGAATDTTFTDSTLCAAIASEQDTLDQTYGSVVMAGNNNLINFGANHVIMAGDSNMIQTLSSSAIIASHLSQIGAGSPAPGRAVLMASRNCHVELGTVRSYVVAGGYDVGGAVPPSWRLESNGGIMRSTAAHTVGGLDYAELFENGDRTPHRPGRLLTRRGPRAHLAQPGDRILGPPSVNPTVAGGDDGIAWAKRYVRDKWGAYQWEEVDATQSVYDPAGVAAWDATRKSLRAERRQVREAALTAETRDKRRQLLARARALSNELKNLKPPAKVVVTERVRQMKVNPQWDPSRAQVSRRDRPAEWTLVALLGQVPVAIGPDVAEGDALMPGKDGLGVTATRDYLLDGVLLGGKRVEVMSIVEPYDAELGEGVALCLIY